jgi:hypothetical protein
MLVAIAACHKSEPPPIIAAPVPAPVAQRVPPELESLNWSSVSEAPGELVEMVQTAFKKGSCHVVARVGSRESWSADACLATRLQLRFLSPDGDSLLVLLPSPATEGQPINDVRVGTLYKRGVEIAKLTPGSLGYSHAQAAGHQLLWLGARDQKAKADGVEVQLSDGTTQLIRFDGTALLQAAPVVQAAASAKTMASPAVETVCQPCAYTDDEGTYHLAQSLDEIPAKYRSQATRTRAAVSMGAAPPVPASYGGTSSYGPAPMSQSQREATAKAQADLNGRVAAAQQNMLPVRPQPQGCTVMENDGTRRPCDDYEKRRQQNADRVPGN